MTTISHGGPPAAAMCDATVLACQRASWLPRVPRRRTCATDVAYFVAARWGFGIWGSPLHEPLPWSRFASEWFDIAGRLRLAQSEKARERLGIRHRRVGVAERLQLLGWRHQQLLDDQVGHLVDARTRFGRQRRHLELEPFELGAPDLLEPLAQRDDGGNGAARAEPCAELLDLLEHDRFRARDLARAPREVLAHRRLQVVDVVEEDLLDLAGFGLDVARQRDVDDEERPVAPPAHHRLGVRLGQDRRRGAG